MTDLRSNLLGLGRALVADLGPGAPDWEPTDVTWDWIGSSLPSATADLTVDVYADPGPTRLGDLRDARAAAMVTFVGGVPSARVVVAVPVWHEPGRLVAEYAAQLQDHVVESRAAWGRPLPACPDHPEHPLSVRHDDVSAWWWCERGRRIRDLPELAMPLPWEPFSSR